ncbi:MAG: hypothetical protein Q9165_004702 [Trypethelium subeluteriae]
MRVEARFDCTNHLQTPALGLRLWGIRHLRAIVCATSRRSTLLSLFPPNPNIPNPTGINDIGDSDKYNITQPNFPGFPTFYNTIQTTEYAAVQQLHDRFNYRNFLFLTLPPLDRTPGNVASSAPNPNATMVGWYNSGLASHTAAFAAANPDSNVMLFDAHGVLSRILDAPAGYGIKNTTGYCAEYDAPDILTDPEKYGCLPQEEYFWFNTGHLTSHVHRILAGELEEFLVGKGR